MSSVARPFPPLAVVGQACVLPGALSPADLWSVVRDGRDVVTDVPHGRFRIDPALVTGAPQDAVDATWSTRGGYVRGFAFDDAGLDLPRGHVDALDPLVHWVLTAGRGALVDAGFDVPLRGVRAGAVLGNLSFPTEAMTLLGEQQLLDEVVGAAQRRALGHPWSRDADVRNRFMSGLPAHLLASALHLDAGAFCLDAACASSLYALRLAALALDEGRADVMLAGAVNRADSLFLHVGFCALKALSPSGRSRPFHRDADGLIPAEGCGVVALMRLDDAVRQGKKIHGVIRGVGLSNDGRSKNLLAPASDGQVRAIRAAWAGAGLDPRAPDSLDVIECHATGTPTGDRTEVETLVEVFGAQAKPIPVGSFKSNAGHLITAAGVAGLMKVLGALAHEELPPTLHVEEPLDALAHGETLRLLSAREHWRAPSGRPRRAAVSAFGFGGNNAHAIVEEFRRERTQVAAGGNAHAANDTRGASLPLAVVAVGLRAGAVRGLDGLVAQQHGGTRAPRTPVDVSLDGLRFPPHDLRASLAQQLLVFEAARDAVRALGAQAEAALPSLATGVFVGMGTDVRVTSPGLRWRAPELGRRLGAHLPAADADALIRRLRDAATPALDAQAVLGCMPNIPANRLNVQLDLRGPGFTVSSEELSGITALETARALIGAGELEAALVGATEAGQDVRQARALAAVRPGGSPGGEGAVVLVVMREERARALGLSVLATLGRAEFEQAAHGAAAAAAPPTVEPQALDVTAALGDTHAAAGLFAVAAAVARASSRLDVAAGDRAAHDATRTTRVHVQAYGGARAALDVEARDPASAPLMPAPRILAVAAATRAALIEMLSAADDVDTDELLAAGPWRAAVVGADEAELAARRRDLLQALTADGSGGRIALPGAWAAHAAPLRREQVALLFGTAAPMVPGMGRALLAAFPDVGDALEAEVGPEVLREIRALARHAQDPQGACLGHLAAASVLTQLHARVARDVLKLPFGKTLGISLGEPNALFAVGVWGDIRELLMDMERSRLFDAVLYGDHSGARALWRQAGRDDLAAAPSAWSAVLVRAPAADVLAACALPGCAGLVFPLVKHTDDEVEVGGAPEAIEALVAHLRTTPVPLPHIPAMHCPFVEGTAQVYRRVHHRRVTSVNVDVYSAAAMAPIAQTDDAVADALLAQARSCVDVPALVRRVVEDGARVLVDMSPRGLAGRWAERTLRGTGVEVCSIDGGLSALFEAAARLVVAGVPVALGRLATLAPRATRRALALDTTRPLQAVQVPSAAAESMAPPPALPRILARSDALVFDDAASGEGTIIEVTMPDAPHAGPSMQRTDAVEPMVVSLGSGRHPGYDLGDGLGHDSGHDSAASDAAASMVHTLRAQALAAHHGALEALAQGHQHFLAHQQAWTERVLRLGLQEPTWDVAAEASAAALTMPSAAPHAAASVATDIMSGDSPRALLALWSRADLERLASGSIADVWGEGFRAQDAYRRQVRMPRPPLLLADRVMSIDATAGRLEKDRSIVTETDVRWDSWYLHEGRCPAGILIETGQADLLLVSYMGVDAENRGDRVYRLLGCDLTYRGPLPVAGTTLQHDIHVDGYATAPMKGRDVRIFFFHSDTWVIDAEGNRTSLVLSVRNGQAGFFSDAELADSGGILWTPADVPHEVVTALPHTPPPCPTRKRTLGREELVAFSEGDAFSCFGAGFERAAPHVRTPRIAPGRMLLVDRVTELDLEGGPWGRGVLRAELDLTGDNWFFDGHFQDDPCMPGTVMFEGCLETLGILLAAAGFTLERDGFRFEPVVDNAFKLRCRGQATPKSRLLVYEVFVRAFIDGPEPSVVADILVTVDGLKSLHCDAVELKLVRDWPLSSRPDFFGQAPKTQGFDAVGGVGHPADASAVFTQRALLATGIGKPSEGFPGLYEPFDDAPRVPRLPGPPYHFMSRVVEVGGPAQGALGRGEDATGTRVVVEYDVPADAWFFGEARRSQGSTMPFAVLLEVALQPCGFVSSLVGSALTSQEPLYYRNLDGRARLHREVPRDVGTLVIRSELLKSSSSGGMIIQELSFAVTTAAGEPVFDGTTVFGFFPAAALARQVGTGSTPEERARLAERQAGFTVIDLQARPPVYFDGALALPDPMLLMIDRVTSYEPRASKAGLARVRTEKSIDVREWFFKAHFFQDPVQPGSLGVEAMIQALMWTAIHERRHEGMTRPRFESLATHEPVVWKYRGQVIPKNKLVQVEIDVTSVHEDRATGSVTLKADAGLWVDGTRIYLAEGLAVRIVDDG